MAVFIDYQNMHISAHRRFQPPGTKLTRTHLDPVKLGRLIVQRRRGGGVLVGVRVYRGLPDSERQPGAAAANERQAAAWLKDKLVTVIRRPLRYPKKWPVEPAQEKGIDVALAVDYVGLATDGAYDVGIVASRDGDLPPVLDPTDYTSR